MSTDQERGLRILDNALWRIARRSDCDYLDDEKSRPTPCDCARCIAIAALDAAKNWRFHGAHHGRVGSGVFPRETKMHASWSKLVGGGLGRPSPDQRLSQILNEKDSSPSARDWYVATSVVQWLATNVGMTVLEGAGFKYQQWEQDTATSETFQRRQEREDNARAREASSAVHVEVPALADGQRQSLRVLRDLFRGIRFASDDQDRCDPGLAWLDDLLGGGSGDAKP